MAEPLEPDEQAVRAAVAILSEHYAAVSVFVSREDDGGTISNVQGSGNWYARVGHVREWLTIRDAQARQNARRHRDDD